MKLELPELVEATARSLGEIGERWVRELPEVVASLTQEWHLTLGEVLSGGTQSLVVEALTGDGEPAVLKIAMPEVLDVGAFERGVAFHELAGGHGTARLLAVDHPRQATLMERLGPSLFDLGVSPRRAREIICGCLTELWQQPLPDDANLRDGAEKAHWLAEIAVRWWEELDHPCAERTMEVVLGFVEQRIAAHDPERAVLVHGDAHDANTLQAGDGHKLVDPEGLRSMPAHDLAVPMRETHDELLAGDPLELGLARARHLHELTGVDVEAIWQWGSIERVSSGLYVLSMGHEEWAHGFLSIADAWALRT
jgi:streptomycin 6-kinase